ncbi:MAG: TRAP transporter small permease subunit [Methylococcaceae bacterium]|nr:TRAP transporter small permease subunit [Methylococcaceae bacterium]
MQTPNWANKAHDLLLKTEATITIGLLLSMITLATTQIIMRNLFDSGILWAESYIRIAVLWLALLGAMLASHHDKHLAIDAIMHKLSGRKQQWLKRFNDLFSSIICFIIAYHSTVFVYSEYEDGGIAFEQVPNWLCEAIMPIAFAMIACRYLIASLFNLRFRT